MKVLKRENLLNILVFLLAFAIPVKDQLSTLIMLLLLAYLIALVFIDKEVSWAMILGKHKLLILVPSMLLLIRILALINPVVGSSEWEYAIRAVPFVLLPLIGVSIANLKPNRDFEGIVMNGLLSGLMLIFLICEGNVIYQMVVNNEPFEYLFRWRHLNIQFAEIVRIHPPYLGLITAIVVIWTFYRKPRHYKLILFLLTIFLLQLLARNAILFLGALWILHSVYHKKFRNLAIIATVAVVGLIIIQNHPSRYLRAKLNSAFEVTNSQSRFVRLGASWKTFLEHPVIGTGKVKAQERRRYYYDQMQDERALKQDLNAHNQYMEYLSNYGILGFLIFIGVLIYLVSLSLGLKQFNIYILFLCVFLFAFMTESVLERSLGIKFFALIICLLAMKRIYARYEVVENLEQH